ncbi:MAG: tetratricopeptide repeat protein [Myxococcota bacterium]
MVSARDLFEEGVWHAAKGDSLRAEQYLSAARDRGFPSNEVVPWLVAACVASSRYRAALAHAARHLRQHPSDSSVRLVVANIYDALGDFGNARIELQRIVEEDPKNALSHYRLGLLYEERFQAHELATRHLSMYRQLDPKGEHVAEVEAILAGFSTARAGGSIFHTLTDESSR